MQATRKQRMDTLSLQLEELEDVVQIDYKEIEQEFDRLVTS
jgi:DNA repair protein RecN (Recombination protein N)